MKQLSNNNSSLSCYSSDDKIESIIADSSISELSADPANLVSTEDSEFFLKMDNFMV